MYRNLLVPVDGSAPSKLALLEAIKSIKSMGGGKLRLVHVVDEFVMEPTYIPSVYYQSMVEALRSVGQATLDDAGATVRQHALQPESILLETMGHRVADHVVAQAKEWPADLIGDGHAWPPRHPPALDGERCGASGAHLRGADPAGARSDGIDLSTRTHAKRALTA